MTDKKRARELTMGESDELDQKYPYDRNAPQCHDGAISGTFAFLCTRERGHDGPHIARAPKGPIAIWDE